MGKDVKIRRADEQDLEDILKLNLKLFKYEYEEFNDKTLNLDWTYSEKGKLYFSKIISSKDSFVLVAEADTNVIGYFTGNILGNIFYRTSDLKYAGFGSMFIEEQFRSGGIGTKMVNDFLIWCKEKQVNNISVTAFSKNHKALDFYKKFGLGDYTTTLELNLK